MKISIVMPVCAWPTPRELGGGPHPFLWHSLDSVLGGNHDDIEILVGIDGDAPRVREALLEWSRTRSISPSKLKIYQFPYSGTFGNRQRNELLSIAAGDLICFQDQDDCFFHDALRGVNRIAQQYPGRPLIFKMQIFCFGNHTRPMNPPAVLWQEKGRVECGHIGGHMLVVPNQKQNLGNWREDVYEGDWVFIKDTLENFTRAGMEPYWSEEYISKLRPWVIRS